MMPFEYSIFSDICEEWNNNDPNGLNNPNNLMASLQNGQMMMSPQQVQVSNQMGIVLPAPATNGSPTNPPEEVELKKKIRRSNQNLASREYRKRKRERLEELEEMVKNLTQQVNDLTAENAKLKARDIGDLLLFDAQHDSFVEITKIIDDIRNTLAAGENNPNFNPSDTTELDTSLLCMLQLFWFSIEKKQSFLVTEIDKMVNPALQAKLAVLGYSPSAQSTSLSRIFSMRWFEDFKKEMNLSPELLEQIAKIDEKNKAEEVRMFEERAQIDKDIKDFYYSRLKYQKQAEPIHRNKSPPQVVPSTPVSNNTNSKNSNSHSNQSTNAASSSGPPAWLRPENIPSYPPIHEILEFTRKISELKKSFVNHRAHQNRTYMQIFKLLNPRQQAHLILKAYDNGPIKHKETLEFTTNLWRSVSNQDPTSLKYVTMLMNGTNTTTLSQ
eukprot:TRINITY_DN189_c0_g1_i1.p1 TRINITY_DN189_c0_g1~~TRINITY_DN189_c0_g1_i1.p1  ORF type:complete len:441 (-),score=89.96 TRINITY_DN189_c0_g1_i1:195-1517(-)